MAEVKVKRYTPTEHKKAVAAGQRKVNAPTAVMNVAIIHDGMRRLRLQLRNGATVEIPVSKIDELRGVSSSTLEEVRINPLRDGLSWDCLDIDISAPGLIADFFGSAVTAAWGHKAAGHSSKAKAAAARANGRKGGRPRRVLQKA